ncbi:non-ribosomal peptide synthetase [Actinosynnema sp. NPDC047251]|uniref:Phenyloxazoline synthase MbtB n=1 Tax=Saccharothrix espanaensis (strain ATCC 51144 / DSM 44229 / JCM 9112 / NBRC 15066 / NRRL 15764) TaxID=1179773 RepID=K0K797_SACES|nr:non-ribosomal peptide synthetase [Saccharothrix espanaensis]CCH32769.1 Non-ribosomal peptide synthetase [Saccharothrix espanaensis DSM 44229]
MTTVQELVADLARRGVLLWADGDELRVRAPRDALTDELRTALKEHKDGILTTLRERAADLPAAIPKVVPAPAELHEPFPLTDMQQAIFAGGRDAFEIGELSGNGYIEVDAVGLDLDRFTASWRQVIQRHAMLRAVVLPDGRNKILPEVPEYEIEVTDLRGRSEEEIAARMAELRLEMPREVFARDTWPLFRMRATLLDGDRTRLHLGSSLLVADSLSLMQIWRELSLLNTGEQLPAIGLSTRDYVVAKTALKGTPVHERALDYWRRRLPTLPPPPELPIQVARTDGPMVSKALTARILEADSWARFKARVQESGLMPGVALLTAFCDVAALWSKTEEFSVNAPFWDRMPIHEDVDKIVGSFALPNHLRVTSVPDSTFLERAQRLQRQLIEDLEHCRYVSGVQVMRELAKAYGGTPRRNTYVVFNSVEMSSLDISGLGELGYTVSQTPQVYLEVRSAVRNGGLEFIWDVLDSVFPPGLAEDMLDAFVRHVRRLAEVPGSWEERSRRYLVPEAHRLTQAEANSTAAPVPEGLLHGQFEAQAADQPDRPAVVSAAGTITYGELDRHATRIGRWLRDQGVRPNTLVGVVMDKGWAQVPAVLGVLKSGAAYLPLDASLPRERLHRVLAAAGVGVVLTRQRVDRHVEWPENTRRLRVDTQLLTEVSEEPLEPVQREDDLAYVIFTSGSTGVPKGVMISHRSALNTIVDINRRFGIGPDDGVLGLSSLSFDLSVYDVFGTLAAGGRLVLPDESGLRDPAHWLDLIRDERVTVWNSVPGFMGLLVQYAEGVRAEVPASLRVAMLSGDWIPVTLPDRLRRLVPDVRVISLGGATEASIWSITHEVHRVDPDWTSIPYGKPLANQQVHVLDRDLDVRPLRVPGGLYIGGVGVADGYWRDEQATSAAFITHPRTGERLYRTGDIGRRLPDGSIEILGREDFQVKIGGYRIELGEIESTIREHPAVREAVVLAVDDGGDGKRLVAYVVAAGGRKPETGELRTFVRDKLPEYMVPKTVVLRDELPLTANGKIDRDALAGADVPQLDAAGGPVAPRTPLEVELARHWCDVLGLEEVGVHDSFFELSDDSLQAVNLVSKISDTVGKQLGVRFLFAHPTIAELSASFGDGDAAGQDRTEDGKVVSANGNGEVKPGSVRTEKRDLLTLYSAGQLPRVDGAGVLATPAGLFERAGLDPGDVAHRLTALDLPHLCGIVETNLGRIATIMVPRLDTADLYLNRDRLVETIIGGIEMGARLGAKNISLSGLLVTATDYARSVAAAIADRTDLPPVTSGHETTSAAVLLNVENMLRMTGRRMQDEVLGILGVGSVGKASMHLLLKHLPHPRKLVLCDPYAATSDSPRGPAAGLTGRLRKAADEAVNVLGYRGEIQIIGGISKLPDEFYETTVISADTNAPDIVDIAKLRPGTMLVDDSIPPCYDRDVALARIEEKADLLFSQGDVIECATPMQKLFGWPPLMYELAGQEGVDWFAANTPDAFSTTQVTSSVLSNVLVAQPGIAPATGPADPDRAAGHIDALRRNGYTGGPPQCDGVLIPEESVARFVQRFGAAARVAGSTT